MVESLDEYDYVSEGTKDELFKKCGLDVENVYNKVKSSYLNGK